MNNETIELIFKRIEELKEENKKLRTQLADMKLDNRILELRVKSLETWSKIKSDTI